MPNARGPHMAVHASISKQHELSVAKTSISSKGSTTIYPSTNGIEIECLHRGFGHPLVLECLLISFGTTVLCGIVYCVRVTVKSSGAPGIKRLSSRENQERLGGGRKDHAKSPQNPLYCLHRCFVLVQDNMGLLYRVRTRRNTSGQCTYTADNENMWWSTDEVQYHAPFRASLAVALLFAVKWVSIRHR